MNMRTPLKNARRLGSAREGTDHFWMQRVTAVANLFLGLYVVWLIASLAGADYAAVKEALGSPVNAILLLLLIVSATMHMRIGMQVIVEDYVTGEGAKVFCLLANTFFAIVIAAASVWAILKLSFAT
ncbi:MAG: succinate dehydrogenase [Alphaproteobacteria bacterium BRH_c36]|nr:MAG: succinate dehydrogenase [Alphaproteobacteria bacterium BRH_c36]